MRKSGSFLLVITGVNEDDEYPQFRYFQTHADAHREAERLRKTLKHTFLEIFESREVIE